MSPPSAGTAAQKTLLLFPRAQSQAGSPAVPGRCVHRLGGRDGPRDCGDPGGPHGSQHLSLALPPRRRLHQPAPARAPPAGSRASPRHGCYRGSPTKREPARPSPRSFVFSRDPLPIGRPQPPRHVPASSLPGSQAPRFILVASLGVPAGKPGTARGGARTVVKGASTHQRGWGRWPGLDANVRRSALTAEMGTVVAITPGKRQRLLLNRSSIIQIETPPHPSRACQPALQLAYLRLLVITWLTQPLPILNPSITPARTPPPSPPPGLSLTTPHPPSSTSRCVLQPLVICWCLEQRSLGSSMPWESGVG